MWAVNSSNLPLVSFLLSHGADLEAVSHSGVNCETFILSSSNGDDPTSSLSASGGLSKSFLTSLQGISMSNETGTASLARNDGKPMSPHSSDRELIAEMIYEFGQVLKKEKNQRSDSRLNHLNSLGTSSGSGSSINSRPNSRAARGSLNALYQRGSNLSSTLALPTSPSSIQSSSSPFHKSPRNTLARKHSRASSYNPNPNSNLNMVPDDNHTHNIAKLHTHTRHSSLSLSSLSSSPNPTPSDTHTNSDQGSGTGSGNGYGNVNLNLNGKFGSRRLIGRNEKVHLAEKQLKERELSQSRRRALLDISITLETDYQNLIGLPPLIDDEISGLLTNHNDNPNAGGGGGKPSNRMDHRSIRNQQNSKLGTNRNQAQNQNQKSVHSGLASGSGSSEVGCDPLSLTFRFDSTKPLFSQLLVISHLDLSILFQQVISEMKPFRAPWINRTIPANILFLAARWTALIKDADLLEDLLLGAVDRIQEIVHEKSKDLAYLAFWLGNCTVLLHYLKRDKVMNIYASDGKDEYQVEDGDGDGDGQDSGQVQDDQDETFEIEDDGHSQVRGQDKDEDEDAKFVAGTSITSVSTRETANVTTISDRINTAKSTNINTTAAVAEETEEEAALNAELALSLHDCRLFLLDLINELYVFVVRDVERRIDRVLDAALLDHDAIPGFEELKFEGEWNLMKSLKGSVKAATSSSSHYNYNSNSAPTSSSSFPSTTNNSTVAGANNFNPHSNSIGSSPSGSSSSRRPISQIFNRNTPNIMGDKGNETSNQHSPSSSSSSPLKKNVSPGIIGHGLPDSHSHSHPHLHPLNRSSPRDNNGNNNNSNFSRLRETSYDATAADLLSRPSPRTITTILTSTLQILQLYEINPAIIIQTFSQIFFWLSCELFNRILKNRKYLSRSRAMQIRLNISSLEDWSRNNAIPLNVMMGHLLPVKHLISWIQCQSSLKDFDGLIMTLQGLKELTPRQMRRTVQNYRYEVGEERISLECEQYLEQLEIDWERRNQMNRKLEEEKELEFERGKQQRKERRQTEKEIKEERINQSLGKMGSHMRDGTATQTDYKRSFTSSSLNQNRDGEEDGDKSNETALMDYSYREEDYASGSEDENNDDSSSINSEDLLPSERMARSSQKAIDSLFHSGKSLNDYTPPWTTSGSSKGPGSGSNDRDGLLNSRDMLPFALPSDTEALIVTPGDPFGMGRGHWTGTGTPSLRSQAGSSDDCKSTDDDIDDDGDTYADDDDDERSINSSLQHHLQDRDLDSSIPPSPSPSSKFKDSIKEKDKESIVASSKRSSSISINSDTSSRCSNLYPQGKGFKSGSNWQPVPILPEGLLESLTDKFKENSRLRLQRERSERLNAGLLSPIPSPFIEIDGFANQQSVGNRRGQDVAGHQSRAEYFGYQEDVDVGSEDEEHHRYYNEAGSRFNHQSKPSIFSAIPTKLIMNSRNHQSAHSQQPHREAPSRSKNHYVEPQYREQSHERSQSEDAELVTPTDSESKSLGLRDIKGQREMKSSGSEKTIGGSL